MNWSIIKRCVAITARGERCRCAAVCAHPITFTWDPIKGRGTGAPYATLCRMHDYVWSLAEGERVEVVGGWLGRGWNPDAKVWTVTTTVYESRAGFFASPHWYALRRKTVFGLSDETTYDEAMAQIAS